MSLEIMVQNNTELLMDISWGKNATPITTLHRIILALRFRTLIKHHKVSSKVEAIELCIISEIQNN